MPIEWLLVGQAALNASAGLAAKGVLGKAAQAGAGLFQRGGPIDKDLVGALGEAGKGFEAFFRALYPDDRDLMKLVEQIAEREDFQQALGSLPYAPFASIEVELVRQVFAERRGSDDAADDFDGAWRAAGKRFAQAGAKNVEVGRFVELQHRARSEEREEAQLATIEEMRSFLKSIAERLARAEAPPDEEPILGKYRLGVYRDFRYADTSGLFQREKVPVGEAIGLEEIFVETPLGREPQRRIAPAEGGEGDANKASEKRRQKPDAPSEPMEIRPIREVLSRDPLTVILGPPGSGKSTLMRCLALSVCRPADAPPPVLDGGLAAGTVPVLLALKEYASALHDDSNLELESFLFERFASRLPHLRGLLDSGRALLLFDGFDEVFDELHRLWVKNQVWSLASQFPAARIVLTSRPHGYASAPLPGPVAVWKIQPFGETAIRRFLHGWFTALAREGGEAGSQDPPEKQAEALATEILSRERLKEMAENPLLSTLIVLVHRNRSGRLPDRRVVFFKVAAETFAESWERAKHAPKQQGEERYKFPEPEILLRALAEVAWRAHHELGSREIPGDTLREWLGAYLEREPEWSGARGRRAIKDFLRLVDQRTGLLVELGGGAYQIVHLSLHEWFVSYYLLDRLPPETRLAVLRHYLHVPEWEEVLRLTIAGARQAEAEAMTTAVLDRPSNELETLLRRDLRFVLRCLEDQAPIGPDLRHRIAAEAVRVLQNPGPVELTWLMGALPPLRGTSEIRQELLRRVGDPATFGSTLPFFAKVGGAGENVRRALLLHLANEAPEIRYRAIDFCARIAAGDELIRQAVLSRFDDEDAGVRFSAIHFFAQTGAADESVRQAVLAKLADEEPNVRASAIRSLPQIGPADESVRRAVFSRLEDDDSNVRSSAIRFFARIDAREDAVRQAVLSRLDDEAPNVRSSAILYFAQIGPADESVRPIFLTRLSAEDPGLRSSAIEFFGKVEPLDESFRQAVFPLLADPDPGVLSSAIDFFAKVGTSDGAIRQAVLSHCNDEDSRARSSTMDFFAMIGFPDEAFRQNLLSRLEDPDPQIRSAAIDYLTQIGAADEASRQTVFPRLEDPDPGVLSSAIDYFAKSGTLDETVQHAILSRLDDEDDYIKAIAFQWAFPGDFLSTDLERYLDLYRAWGASTDGSFDLLFADKIGRSAALDPALKSRLLKEGPKIEFFELGTALDALAAEQDRLRRTANPLPF